METMKKSFSYAAALLVILCITGQLYAQDNESHPNTSSGSFNLMYSLNGFGPFGVTGLSGNGANDPKIISGFGARYYLGDKFALRAMLNFGTRTDGKDSNASKATVVGIGLGAEYHCHQLYSTDIYVGGGIGYNSLSATNATSLVFKPNSGTPSPQASSESPITKIAASAFGVTVLAGFDWYLWNGVALGAEYSLGFVSSSTTQTLADGTTQNVYNLYPATAFGISGGTNIHLVVAF